MADRIEHVSDPDRPHAEIVDDEMIRLLFHNGAPALLAGLLVAVLVYTVLSSYLGHVQPAIWLSLYTLLAIGRLAIIKFAGDLTDPANAQPRPAIHYYTMTSLLSGIAWASLLLFYKLDSPVIAQLFLLVVVSGVPISALAAHSVYPPVFTAFALPIFLGLMAWAVFGASDFKPQFLGLTIMYMILLITSAKAYYRSMHDAFLARLRNRELVDMLSQANRELETLAYIDPVTSLANRRQFQRQLELALQTCERQGCSLALLLVDLDHFKEINDAYGHHIGDRLLQRTAECLLSALGGSSTPSRFAARYGGDEFIVALPDTSTEQAVHLSESILHELSATVTFGDIDCSPTATIGIAMFPDDARSVDKLTRHADMAMYAAKNLGRNRLHVYNSGEIRAVDPATSEAASQPMH